MENFVVSARKYRPDSFDSVVGQSSITRTLKNAIKANQLAHAYLFCGPRGVGKTTCARIFAKTINCQNIQDNTEACGECESCQSFRQNRSFNIHELDAASNNHVDDIRNLIEQVRIPPQLGRYSIYIIDEVHMLSQQAFNAFLKTLEEPPAHAIFILATTEKHKIIPTILSRCQIFDFHRLKVSDMMQYLSEIASNEEVEADDAALNIIAQKADGSMRDALSIFDQVVSFSGKRIDYHTVVANLNVLDYEYYFTLTDAFLHGNYQSALMVYNEILNKGFDSHNFINGLGAHFRNLLVTRDPETIQLLELSGDIADKYIKYSKECSVDWLLRGLQVISACDISYKQAKDQRLHTEIALLKLSDLSGQIKEAVAEQGTSNSETDEHPMPDKPVKPAPPAQASQQTKPVQDIQPTHEETKNKTDNRIASGLKTGPRISDYLNKKDQSETNDNQEEADNKAAVAEFTEDGIIGLWKEFAEGVSADQPRLYNTLKSQLPRLNGDQVMVKLNNPLQAKALKSIHFEIEEYLKKNTGNKQLKLEYDLENHPAGEKKLYTQEEKYKHLHKKNPDLDMFRQTFKLDFE